jgi:hypothetical protein
MQSNGHDNGIVFVLDDRIISGRPGLETTNEYQMLQTGMIQKRTWTSSALTGLVATILPTDGEE